MEGPGPPRLLGTVGLWPARRGCGVGAIHLHQFTGRPAFFGQRPCLPVAVPGRAWLTGQRRLAGSVDGLGWARRCSR